MPRRAKGARLQLRKAHGTRQAVWIIRDGRYRESTGCGPSELGAAEQALREYITKKYQAPRLKKGDPSDIRVADVITIYSDDVAPSDSRPKELAKRLKRVVLFFGAYTLADINTALCRRYVEHRAKTGAARRELEDLRAAIGHHYREGLCAARAPVWVPPAGVARERWLTRQEAARLLWAAYRYREIQKGQPTDRRSRRHVARFILVALYTGTRAGAICNAALQPAIGRGWVDLDNGIFHRRAAGAVQTKKRAPTIRIPPRLLAHIRRWHRLKLSVRSVVEWNGNQVKKINKAFRGARADAKLGTDVVPHVLRHTCATWLAQRGTPVNEICGFLGMTEEMFERVYGHHHPDYQSAAVNALTKRPTKQPTGKT